MSDTEWKKNIFIAQVIANTGSKIRDVIAESFSKKEIVHQQKWQAHVVMIRMEDNLIAN